MKQFPNYRKVLTVQDISCVGQCSITVALPILSACGMETCILPSAVLSTHTGGFSGYTVRDLTDDIPGIVAHWRKENIRFDCIYTGYLGSTKQIGYVQEILATMGKENCLKVVDPAMADNGKLYWGFDDAYVAAMRPLCADADIILPNITEAAFLTGIPYRENYDEAHVDEILSALTKVGAKTVVLTGIGFAPDQTGVMVYENGEKRHYIHKKLAQSCHGTGDVFASAFTGAVCCGNSVWDAARIAADYTVTCMENTVGDETHWYGVKFETALPDLMKMLGK